MAIEFICPTCNGTLRVGDESAGRVIRCGACQTMLRVPGEVVSPPPPPLAAVPVAPPRASVPAPVPTTDPAQPHDAEPDAAVTLADEPLDAELLDAPAAEPREAEPTPPAEVASTDEPRESEPESAAQPVGRSWNPDWNNPYDAPRRDRDRDRPRRRRRPPAPPPGRGALFWLVVIGGVFCLLTFGCCGGMYLLIPGPKWQKHESARGGFRVDLPAPPRNDMDKIAGEKPDPSAPMEGTILFGRMEEYAIVYRDIPAHELRFGMDKQLLDEAVKGMKDTGEVTVIRQKDITVGGFPAREVEFSAKGSGWYVARIIIADSRVYVIIAGGRFASPGNENAKRFLDSFEIIDPKLKTVGQKKADVERQRAEEVAKREEEQRVAAERARRVQEHAQKQRDADIAFMQYEHDGPEPGRLVAGKGEELAEYGFGRFTRWNERTDLGRGPFGGPGVSGMAWYPTVGVNPGFRAYGPPRPNHLRSGSLAATVDPNGYSVAGWVRVRYIPITPISVHATYGKEEPLAEITATRTHFTARIAGSKGTVEFKHAWTHDEKWHHVALVRTPTGAKLYLDGEPVVSSDTVAPRLPDSVGLTFGWLRYTDPEWPGPSDADGKPANPQWGHIIGAVDECMVIARALTDAEVAKMAGRKTPGE